MPSLYDLTEDLIKLEVTIIEALEEHGELTNDEQAMIDQAITEIREGSKEKLVGYAKVLLGMKARQQMIEAEYKRLRTKAEAVKNAQKRMKEAIHLYMDTAELKKIEAGSFAFTICKNGGKTPLLASILPEALPEKYQVVRIDADNEMIRRDLEDGQVIEGMKLGVRGTHVKVR